MDRNAKRTKPEVTVRPEDIGKPLYPSRPNAPLPPLNGTKTHPLSPHALRVLRDLWRHGPVPTQEINPGVVNRFHREFLTETVAWPSPYKVHRGGTCPHERITADGERAVREAEAKEQATRAARA